MNLHLGARRTLRAQGTTVVTLVVTPGLTALLARARHTAPRA
jgi:hypothetical protein